MTVELNVDGASRRGLLRGAGLGLAGSAAMAAIGTAGLLASTQEARANAATDEEVFNFALNLEYLEAEYYSRAVAGTGLTSDLTGGTPSGAVVGGSQVPFVNTAIAYAAQTIAQDEIAHVRYIRSYLGRAAVPEPALDLVQSFTTLAVAAGVIPAGQTFDPFSSETNFLIGAYIFEDVGVTAYAGAATLLTKSALPYAAGILGTEAYHAGMIRSRLAEIGQQLVSDQISILRQTLGSVQDDGVSYNGNQNAFTNVDINAMVFRRTTSEVLSIVYGGGTSSGLFYPNGMNGAISQV